MAADWTGMAPGGSSAGPPAVPGSASPVGPHTLRHAFITAALDAGVSLRDVQDAASHADPRTTMRYDRARGSLDRHATYIVAAYVAGAAR
jgi:integrase/recombinase XerD